MYDCTFFIHEFSPQCIIDSQSNSVSTSKEYSNRMISSVCIHLEVCAAVQEITHGLDMLTQSSVCSVGFGRWQSSSGYCLSDEVIYGRGPIFRTGRVLGGREGLCRREHIRCDLSNIQTQSNLTIQPQRSAAYSAANVKYWLVTAGEGNEEDHSKLSYFPGGLVPCGMQTSYRLPRNNLSSYLYCGKGWSSVLSRFPRRLCPAHSSSTWDWAGVDAHRRPAPEALWREGSERRDYIELR